MFDNFQRSTPEPFETSLTTYLSSTGIVVYPYRVPQSVINVYPRIVYGFNSGDHDYVLKGPNGLATATFQFNVSSTSQPEALVLAEQLRQRLHGYRGPMGSATVQNVDLTEYPGSWTPLVDGSDKGTFVKTVEYEITYEETVPVFNVASVVVSSFDASFILDGFGGNNLVLRGF